MGIGLWQIALIVLVVLILFGAGKLPKVMGDVGKGMKSFKDGIKGEDEDEPAVNKNEASDDDTSKEKKSS